MSESIFCALDLELNQPSQKIIQIGAAFGDLETGVIWERKSLLVNPFEPLNPFIVKLTGVEQAQVDIAPSLATQYEELAASFKLHGAAKNPITWGGGDSLELRDQLGLSPDEFIFGRRWIDTKTIYQAWCQSQHKPRQAGLAKAMAKMGLQFIGRKHNALCDAENTFIFYRHLLNKFRA